ncbi:RNA polymerase sigma factor [Undibacterium sp. YM2]|jgi:RNA polymerase sigma-70 factor (ECF subfamily)|uniref:sigma-70 family RNA polymerase sigma factor n=1 Tax=Undibacterium sp. YM2 TaxID=2058625 RepID=UPI001331DD26|nr:sigma-70 family RNA polymerase sigma factor [Undibacterium sp. YM2]BBB69650.1 RNA polymerase sigma factor [Undibacterium sp. YM2]
MSQSDSRSQLLACIPRLRRYARALVGDRAGADDLVQDTMERGWLKLGSFLPDGDMRAWLFSIMHNLRLDQLRKPSLTTVELDDEDASLPAMAASQSHGLELRDLQAALLQLPLEQREVLLLVVLEEMRYEDIALTLNIPLGTVMSRLSRGREKLRAIMEMRATSTVLKVVK